MNAIVNVTTNWGIGKRNNLIVRIPEDMKRFRELTTNKVVIYGHKTLSTFPNEQPLPNRINIILSHDAELYVPNAIVCHNLEELKEAIAAYDNNDIWVIGGASIYKLLLPYCEKAYVTLSVTSIDADAFFPNLDATDEWMLTGIEPISINSTPPFQFLEYTNCHPETL